MGETTGRVLQLLGLLQARALWTGSQLAERLGVSERCIRRDVERLRGLGYQVRASRGVGGGYQLGAGRALPPLLLDAQEAVAVAVSLRMAAGGTVAGVDEGAVRALVKLEQVLPPALRAQVLAVKDATIAVPGSAAAVDPDVLTTLARACRDRVQSRFDYTTRSGSTGERSVEPSTMVVLGHRWYLLAYDLGRLDWRSFRLDRMHHVRVGTFRFTPRTAPDAAAFITRSVTRSPYRYVARVRIALPAAEVAERIPQRAGEIRAVDDQTCELLTGAEDLRWLAVHLALIDVPLQVLEPPELRSSMRDLGQALLAAASGASVSSQTGTTRPSTGGA